MLFLLKLSTQGLVCFWNDNHSPKRSSGTPVGSFCGQWWFPKAGRMKSTFTITFSSLKQPIPLTLALHNLHWSTTLSPTSCMPAKHLILPSRLLMVQLCLTGCTCTQGINVFFHCLQLDYSFALFSPTCSTCLLSQPYLNLFYSPVVQP